MKLPVKWLLSRIKRAVVLSILLLVIVIVVYIIFASLNAKPLSVRWHETIKVSKQRPMVQFYPDNPFKDARVRAGNGEDDKTAAWRDDRSKQENDKDPDVSPWEERLKEKVVPGPKERYHPENTKVLSYDVHLFYYAWYGDPKHDGQYYHWNHKYLDNWNKKDKRQYPTGNHNPNNSDIGANYFPELGAYSSRDPQVIEEHLKQVKLSGAGVLALSWYPPGLSDENGPQSDQIVLPLLNAAEKEGLKVTLHIEPYANLTAENFRKNLAYIREQYGNHPAFYKRNAGTKKMPLFYIYDSYRMSSNQWMRLFSYKGDLSVRGTDLDGIFIGLLVDFKHRADIKQAKFDGFYTYFASNGFTHGSSWKNWRSLQQYATRSSLLFIPSIGPGYIDTRIRPWNAQNSRDRRKGSYYEMAWRSALNFQPKMVTITSFNEWHEGTQIETAIPKETSDSAFTYLSYAPAGPEYYLLQTRSWIEKFIEPG